MFTVCLYEPYGLFTVLLVWASINRMQFKCTCFTVSTGIQFLRATRSIERKSYGNVAGWVAGWLSVTDGIVSKRLNLS